MLDSAKLMMYNINNEISLAEKVFLYPHYSWGNRTETNRLLAD